MSFPNSILIPILTITTLGVLILGWVMMGDKQQPIEMQNTTFTTQQVVSVSWATETITTIDPNTCMTTEIPACKKRFWKDFDDTTCKEVVFEVDCMFYDEVSSNQQEYTELLSEYGLVWREETSIACDAQLIETIIVNGYACEEKDLGKTISDTNTKWMCRDNSRTCKKITRDGKEILLREKNLATRYDPTGKTEICDGRDNDCDEQVDEWYQQKEYLRDFDDDWRGNIDMKTKACTRPPGHVLKAGDCDDLDKAVYPWAYEMCDLKDNNCNRQIDEYLVDCNEKVKECTIQLPLGGNGGLGGSSSDESSSEEDGNLGGDNDTIFPSSRFGDKISNDIIKKKLMKIYPEYIEEIYELFESLYIWLEKFHDRPYIANLLKEFAEIHPESYFEYYIKFKNHPDAKTMLELAVRNAVKNNPDVAIKKYSIYKNESYAKTMLELAVRNALTKDSDIVLLYFSEYQYESYAKTMLEQAVRNVVESNPKLVLISYKRYQYESYAKTMLEQAVRNALTKDPSIALEYYEIYKDELYAKSMLEQAVRNVAENNPGVALEKYEIYKGESYAKTMLEQAVNNVVENNPGVALEKYEIYKGESYAKTMLEQAVRNALTKDPSIALEYYEIYKGESYAKTMLEQAVRNALAKDPSIALEYYEIYKGESYAKTMLEQAVRNALAKDPSIALEYYEIYKGESYAKTMLELAINYMTKNVNYLEYLDQLNNITEGLWDLMLNTLIADKKNRLDLLFLFNKNKLSNDQRFNWLRTIFVDLMKINTLNINNQSINLYSRNINIYAWLFRTFLNNEIKYTSNWIINRAAIKKDYEINISKFIAAGKNFSSTEILSTFIVRADQVWGDDGNGALTDTNNKFIELYQCLGKHGTCTSIRSNEKTITPDEIIALFAKQIHDDPEGYHLFHLWGHGAEDWLLHLAWGDRTKDHFDKLFNLQVTYSWRIRIDITSCNSFWKDDDRKNNTISNISLDSSQQSSRWWYNWTDHILLQAFQKKDVQWNSEADYDGDGVVNYHEALIYRAIHYNLSLTPIMFDDNGKVVDIVWAEILPQDIQDRSDRENDPFVDTQCSMDC
jgi:hypothetical protein